MNIRFWLLLSMFIPLTSVPVQAQITPDVDFKGTASIKPDPVLQPNFEWNETSAAKIYSTLNELTNFKENHSVPQDLSEVNFNLGPVVSLAQQLKSRGAKVDAYVREAGGFKSLNLSVNGEAIGPFIVECKQCSKIVFEY